MPTKKIFLSVETTELLNKDIDYYINKYSTELKVEKALILAISKIESQRYPFAFRFEPQLKKAKWYNKVLTEEERTNNYSYCSYGIMQVLFGIAKTLGYQDNPISLHLPQNSILYGTKLLKKLMKRYKNIKDVISAYNQGSNKKDKKGRYYNQYYVTKVYLNYKLNGGKL